MTLDSSDPRLTAYALGELDEEERIAVESALQSDPSLQREVEQIRATAKLLAQELASSAPSGLDQGQRQRIASEAQERDGSVSEPPNDGPSAPETKGGKVLSFWSRKGSRTFATLLAAAVVGGAALLIVPSVTMNAKDAAMAPPMSAAQRGEALRPAPLTVEPGAVGLKEAQEFGMIGTQVPADKPQAQPSEREEEVSSDDEKSDRGAPGFNRESYERIVENPFVPVAQDPRSTFSIDVDTASYSLVRRFLNQEQLPPRGAVRIEELINYFSYSYPQPAGDVPFSVTTAVTEAPWRPEHRLVRIGLKGRTLQAATRPNANLVFLLDVSGSMSSPDKLPLLKQAVGLLLPQLDGEDRVSIVVYAGASGLVLPPTPANQRGRILGALDRLQAGGSTNGGEGIELAYRKAQEAFIRGGINRVLLATDGDFNVGVTDRSELIRLIEKRAKGGVFLTVLGFGQGNYNDSTLEQLADRGNGNYAYVDNISEARKVLVEQAASTLVTIAKDVKIQVEFNPQKAESYRLIGYENRALRHQDFTDDRKDAGDIGAGHTVTALYEVIPRGAGAPEAARGSMLRYQHNAEPTQQAHSNELLVVKLRYKQPDGDRSRELVFPVKDEPQAFDTSSSDMRFAAAVASFGMLLRGSEHKGTSSFASVLAMASDASGNDSYRQEFLGLVRKAQGLGPRR